jgi:hypothetical protein
MSVYGGFGTRLQESTYGKLTEGLIQALQQHAVSVLKGETINEEEWSRYIYSILRYMNKYEKNKYLPPKYSKTCKELLEVIKSKNYSNNFGSLLNSSVKSNLRLPKLNTTTKPNLMIIESPEDENEISEPWTDRLTPSPEKLAPIRPRELTPAPSNSHRSKEDSPIESARGLRNTAYSNIYLEAL